MSQERAELDLELPAKASSVPRARAALAEIAHRVGAPADDVKLAVSEAVGNAVMHAFRDGRPGTITLHARHDGEHLRVRVGDDGLGMTPHIDSPGLGLGLSLITRLALDVRFDSTESGTTVSMSFPAGVMESGLT